MMFSEIDLFVISLVFFGLGAGLFALAVYRFQRILAIGRGIRGVSGLAQNLPSNSSNQAKVDAESLADLVSLFQEAQSDPATVLSLIVDYLSESGSVPREMFFSLEFSPESQWCEHDSHSAVVSQLARDCIPVFEDILSKEPDKLFRTGVTIFPEQEERLSGLEFVGFSALVARAVGSVNRPVGIVVVGVKSYGQVQKRMEFLQNSMIFPLSSVFGSAVANFDNDRLVKFETFQDVSGLLHDIRSCNERAYMLASESFAELKSVDLLGLEGELIESSELCSMTLASLNQSESIGAKICGLEVSNVVIPLAKRFKVICQKHSKILLVRGQLGAKSLVAPQILRRILSNYLMNSIRYSQGNLICLEIHVSDSHVKFRVMDEGSGMSGVSQGSLQYISKESSNVGGIGIGLSSCDRIARNGGGYAWYTPRGSVGSIFGVAFPRYLEKSDAQPLNDISNSTVLVVDDDEILLRRMSKVVSEYVSKVETAISVSEAHTILKKGDIDCVVADYHLGDRSINCLVESFGAQAPFIICSGGMSNSEFSDLMRLGYFVYLEKPVARHELCAALNASIGKPSDLRVEVNEK